MEEKIHHFILKIYTKEGNSFILCKIFEKFGFTFAEFQEFVSSYPRIKFDSIPNSRQFTFREEMLVFSRSNEIVTSDNYEKWIEEKIKEVYINVVEIKIEKFE